MVTLMDNIAFVLFGALVGWFLHYLITNGAFGRPVERLKSLRLGERLASRLPFRSRPPKVGREIAPPPRVPGEQVPVHLHIGSSINGPHTDVTYWTPKHGNGETIFVAIHMPYGGTHHGVEVPVDGFVLLSEDGGQHTVMNGTLFRILFTVANVAERVQGVLGRPLPRAVQRTTMTSKPGAESTTDPDLDKLAEEFELK